MNQIYFYYINHDVPCQYNILNVVKVNKVDHETLQNSEKVYRHSVGI